MEIIIDFERRVIKLLKTRDLFIIEAHVPFDIDEESTCAEDFDCDTDSMLVKSHPKHFKNLKDIFKLKSKSEIIEMTYLEDQLLFKGDINKNKDYTIQSKMFEKYGNFMEDGNLLEYS
jgi:hypothetical protein